MPKAKNPEQGNYFSQLEMVAASGFTKRNLQLLNDAGLMPTKRDTKALKRVAVVGAFASAGFGAVIAARLVKVLMVEFNQYDGEAPCGMQNEWKKLTNAEIATTLVGDDFSIFAALRAAGKQATAPLTGDVVVHIVDLGDRKRRIFQTNILPHGGPQILDIDGQVSAASYVGWLEGWARGSDDARVVHALEGVVLPFGVEGSAEEIAIAKKIAQEGRDAFASTNIVSQISVNVSLAIRLAFERVIELRAAKVVTRMKEPSTETP